MPETLTFTVDSALLSELGEKLVETPHIALVELVKNAYDADATETTIKIVPNPDLNVEIVNDKSGIATIVGKSSGPEIQITDNGSGMTFQDVKDYWMRIATTHKQNRDVSPRYGRPRTGSKGIGRFSCRRLGTKLKLVTTAARNGSFEQTEVVFNWLDFEPGEEISTIEVEGVRKKLSNALTGTSLIISGRGIDEWNRRGYNF